jgi:arabinan endo-1,5-alpha-L-arabinosidase
MKQKRIVSVLLVVVLCIVSFTGCLGSSNSLSKEEIKKGSVSTGISCHDPQIIIGVDGLYYMTGSHQVLASSSDLYNWDYIANGSNMFSNIFKGDMDAFSFVGKNSDGGYSIWASNIYYNKVMKKYLMYFCTTSSDIQSNLCLAQADSPEGPYEYVTKFLYSGWDKNTVEQTNVKSILGEDADLARYFEYGGYDKDLWPNCIDPAVFEDADGNLWLTYGSWSGGIFVLQLDPSTGLPIHTDEVSDTTDPYFGTRIAGGGIHAIEGPYIDYNENSGYYYLFVSYGSLQSDGGYQIRQFRSRNVTGPYVDAKGNTLEDQEDYSNYGVKMMGNYTLPSLDVTYMAPGGQSIFTEEDGSKYIVYHQRFNDGTEYHEPRIHQMFLNEDDWYTIAPFEVDETVTSQSGHSDWDVDGTYYILNHGIDVGNLINEAVECTLKDGNISSEEEAFTGTYTTENGSDFATFTLDGVAYKGVFLDMKDEAGNQTRVFTAVGDNNQTIWAIQYLKE